MREAEGRVKDAQVIADGIAAEGVNECNSLTLTLIMSGLTTGPAAMAVVLSAIGTRAAPSANSASRRIADRKNVKNINSSLKIRLKVTSSKPVPADIREHCLYPCSVLVQGLILGQPGLRQSGIPV
jgi:hypothetical protein